MLGGVDDIRTTVIPRLVALDDEDDEFRAFRLRA